MKYTLSLWLIAVILLSSRFCFPTMARGIISKTSNEIQSSSSNLEHTSLIKSRKIVVQIKRRGGGRPIAGGSRPGSTSSGVSEKSSSIRAYFVISFSVLFVLFFI
ncbi:hypothetical protein MIMGU_mgv1a016852mg [Erythranthe guttata]|uniref:Uncharacterized protein n=1 Tax=Erythranthe guttata TaxID=4155 RepID=A0A022R3X6_ERYGU|nr:hypothetical protein MIMGU_mgv1a016852mg [Erythranthe guttata]